MSDLIDRQKAIAHLKKRLIETAINNIGVIARCDSIFEDTADNRIGPWINELPSAQPERMRGRWIPNIYPDVGDGYRCSQCGAYHVVPYKFCHNCGADMREVNDERSD